MKFKSMNLREFIELIMLCTENSVIESHLASSKCSKNCNPLHRAIKELFDILGKPFIFRILKCSSPTTWGG